jgi:hypothetical protein
MEAFVHEVQLQTLLASGCYTILYFTTVLESIKARHRYSQEIKTDGLKNKINLQQIVC